MFGSSLFFFLFVFLFVCMLNLLLTFYFVHVIYSELFPVSTSEMSSFHQKVTNNYLTPAALSCLTWDSLLQKQCLITCLTMFSLTIIDFSYSIFFFLKGYISIMYFSHLIAYFYFIFYSISLYLFIYNKFFPFKKTSIEVQFNHIIPFNNRLVCLPDLCHSPCVCITILTYLFIHFPKANLGY